MTFGIGAEKPPIAASAIMPPSTGVPMARQLLALGPTAITGGHREKVSVDDAPAGHRA
jgi:hypothetical protein